MRIAFILILASSLFSRADENAVGRWEGTVQIPGRELLLIVDLATESGGGGGGGWQGSITIRGLGLEGLPLSGIAVKGSDIAFSINGAPADRNAGPAKFARHLTGGGEVS